MTGIPDADIDQGTADLIIQLQLEDVGVFFEISKEKFRESTDQEVAFKLQNEELEGVFHFLNNRRMTMSMAAAVQTDGQVIVNNVVEKKTAINDRDLARNWTRDGQPATAQEAQPSADIESDYLDDEILTNLQALHMSGDNGFYVTDDAGSDHAESSAWAAKGAPSTSTPMHRCVACREETEFFNVVRGPCRHEYCRSWLEEHFEASMNDEFLFPPRCCRQPFALTLLAFSSSRGCSRHLSRTYCYSPQCSTFIHPSNIEGDIATCPECAFATCVSCKERAPTGDCPNDTAMQKLLETAQQNNWQRFYSCWRLVSLEYGCNHMKLNFVLDNCRCGAEFCYKCGERWKTCHCEEWNRHRLRQPDPVPNLPVLEPAAVNAVAARMNLIERTMQELQENHECRHTRWRFTDSPYRCEECFHFLPEYIFERNRL
ncbi:BRcat and Rcat domain-containing protein [Aspergillus undulatus]|uniref:BRcat and Rcat domain-containing protein n=1 Tax=Aspergillus undulatus TaxID=1810928 RepID=UPI003CCCB3C5